MCVLWGTNAAADGHATGEQEDHVFLGPLDATKNRTPSRFPEAKMVLSLCLMQERTGGLQE